MTGTALRPSTQIHILPPSRGGSNGIVRQWNVLLWHIGSKCSGAKEEKRATMRLQALSQHRFTGRLTLCVFWRAHQVTPSIRKATGAANPPEDLTQRERNGELLGLVRTSFDHARPKRWIDNTYKNPLARSFSVMSRRQHHLKRTFKSRSSIRQRFSFYCRLKGCNFLTQKPPGVEFVIFSLLYNIPPGKGEKYAF